MPESIKEIVDSDTMYLGSERLLVHLDIQIQDENSVKAIESVVENVKKQVKKAVPITYSIQIETKTT